MAPGTESGTYGSFIDLATKAIADTQGQTPDNVLRPDYQISADDNVIIQNAEGTPGGLGFRRVLVRPERGRQGQGVQDRQRRWMRGAGAATVNDGTYPLGRTFYIYVSKEKLAGNAALKAFVDYYMSDAGIKAP